MSYYHHEQYISLSSIEKFEAKLESGQTPPGIVQGTIQGLCSSLGTVCLLSPLSKAVYSDTAPLPEKPMAYKGVWWLNSIKKLDFSD